MMIYILYHDYTQGLRLSLGHRVAEVRMYGPFIGDDTDAAEARASIWAAHHLISDDDHTWKVVDLKPVLC
jgi:hypothetical protein